MTTTTNYGYNVVDGSDQVNIQNQIAPNFTAIDTDLKAVSDAAITTAVHTVIGTVHQLVRDDSDRAVIRFVATGDFATGDTFTVDGLSVTARLVNGEALQTGCFKINNCVEAVLVGTVLNVNAINPTVNDAADVTYDNTGSGLTATNVQDAIDEVKSDIPTIPTNYAASAITYNNASSGLSGANAQEAIDEVAALTKLTKLGTYTSLQYAAIPAGAKEILVDIQCGTSNDHYTITIPVESLDGTAKVYQVGLQVVSAGYNYANVDADIVNGIKLRSVYRLNSDVTSSSTMTVYAR